MKGIILAGGFGTRLYPITKSVSKQLLPVYDKPMIYYPLSILLLAGIREILIISTQEDIESYKKLLNDGKQIGVSFTYKIQIKPRGLADAFIIGEDFIGNDAVALILGDNIFYGQGLTEILKRATSQKRGAVIFGYYVNNPKSFGVVEIDSKTGKAISIEEKPSKPKSNYAIPGIYFYDNNVIEMAKSLKPSKRGELEISDINKIYLENELLNVEIFGRGLTWFDTGTCDRLNEASNFVRAIQKSQGFYIANIEEIAFRMGYIDKNQLRILGNQLKNTEYGKYLLTLL